MDRKEAERLARSQSVNDGEKVGRETFDRSRGNSFYSRNSIEDRMVDAIDQKRFLTKYADWIEKLQNGEVDVATFIHGVSPDAAIKLVGLAMGHDSTDKIKLAALQDLLDRAGFGKVQKLAVANVDPSQPKAQLQAMLEGLARKTKAIEIVDDDDQTETK